MPGITQLGGFPNEDLVVGSQIVALPALWKDLVLISKT